MINRFLSKFPLFMGGAILGLLAGAYLFTDVQPRSFLAITRCEQCMNPNEIMGLAASVGIQKAPGLMPLVVLETDKSFAIKHPYPEAEHHYVIFPKKDIKNVGVLSPEDQAYLVDIHAVAGELIRQKNLGKFRIWSNGPVNQKVAYLHYHLVGF